MAVDTPVRPSARLPGEPTGPVLRLVPPSDGIRDDAERVVIPTTDALEPWLEVVAIAEDVIASAERIVMAAAAGSRQAVVNEAGRLAHRVTGCRAEARERIGCIEPGGAA